MWQSPEESQCRDPRVGAPSSGRVRRLAGAYPGGAGGGCSHCRPLCRVEVYTLVLRAGRVFFLSVLCSHPLSLVQGGRSPRCPPCRAAVVPPALCGCASSRRPSSGPRTPRLSAHPPAREMGGRRPATPLFPNPWILRPSGVAEPAGKARPREVRDGWLCPWQASGRCWSLCTRPS